MEELEDYTGKGLNDSACLTTNEAEQIYTIIDIATVRDKRLISTVLVARLANDRVVIGLDRHDKLLVDALWQAQAGAYDCLFPTMTAGRNPKFEADERADHRALAAPHQRTRGYWARIGS